MKPASAGYLLAMLDSIYAHATADLTITDMDNYDWPFEEGDPDGLESLTRITMEDLRRDIARVMDDIRAYKITMHKYYEQDERNRYDESGRTAHIQRQQEAVVP